MKTLVRIMGINTSPENKITQESHSHTPISRQQLTNIKLPKQTADLLRVYCIFNNRKITEYITDLVEEHLAEFRKEMAKEHKRWRNSYKIISHSSCQGSSFHRSSSDGS